jgi:hypothetical protein
MHRSDATSQLIAAANLICHFKSLQAATATGKCKTLPENRSV